MANSLTCANSVNVNWWPLFLIYSPSTGENQCIISLETELERNVTDGSETLISSFMISYLDYSSSLPTGVPPEKEKDESLYKHAALRF